jgi:uncharacterized membrane protein YeaQ/YmgE (transglycosylase-associated protein family)
MALGSEISLRSHGGWSGRHQDFHDAIGPRTRDDTSKSSTRPAASVGARRDAVQRRVLTSVTSRSSIRTNGAVVQGNGRVRTRRVRYAVMTEHAGRSLRRERRLIVAVQWPILIGAIAGLLAKLIISGFGSGGLLLRMIAGIAGALFAAYAGDTIGMYRAGETGGLLGSALGAVVMLIIYQLLLETRRR